MNRQFTILLFFSFVIFSSVVHALEVNNQFFQYLGNWDFDIIEYSDPSCQNKIDAYTFTDKKILLYDANTVLLGDFERQGDNHLGQIHTDGSMVFLDQNSWQQYKNTGITADQLPLAIVSRLSINENYNQILGYTASFIMGQQQNCVVSLARRVAAFILLSFTDKSGNPVSDVKVEFKEINSDVGTSLSAQSDFAGTLYFSKANVDSEYELIFTKDGYEFSQNNIKTGQISKNLLYQIEANPVESEKNARAIIIAGGGNFADPLWPATNANANFAYTSLLYKGIAKDNIRYLNFNTDQDVDNDGQKNDISGIPSIASFQSAILDWAKAYVNDKKPLIIYMLDHGLQDTFFISKPESGDAQTISPQTLDGWLDELQQATGAKVILIYDACFSGSFMALLKATGDQKRIQIYSTQADQLAYFGSRGDLSFSNYFWTHTLKGKSIRDAFLAARSAIKSATNNTQKPVLDDNGDGSWNSQSDGGLAALTYLGNPLVSAAALPVITQTTAEQIIDTGTTLSVYAKVDETDPAKIKRVWLVAVAPDSQDNGTQPITDLKEYELAYNNSTQRYETSISGFDQIGVYKLSFYAQANDSSAFVSLPKTVKIAAFTSTTQINHFFDRVEQKYPQYFSPTQNTQEGGGYLYRYYADKKTAVGVKDGKVYVYADSVGGLKEVGSFSQLDAQIQ